MISSTIILLILINLTRTQNLQISETLTEIATKRAENLCGKKISHLGWERSFDGLNKPFIGENLARGMSDIDLFIAMLNSPTHMKNMQNPNYKEIGIGKACGITVELFTN